MRWTLKNSRSAKLSCVVYSVVMGLANVRCNVLPQLKLEFSVAGVSITPSAGELDESFRKRSYEQWLTAAPAAAFHRRADGGDRQTAIGGRRAGVGLVR